MHLCLYIQQKNSRGNKYFDASSSTSTSTWSSGTSGRTKYRRRQTVWNRGGPSRVRQWLQITRRPINLYVAGPQRATAPGLFNMSPRIRSVYWMYQCSGRGVYRETLGRPAGRVVWWIARRLTRCSGAGRFSSYTWNKTWWSCISTCSIVLPSS